MTVACQKGGVGKSTSVLNLGYALGRLDKKVLLIDLDPQSSLTVCFGVNNHDKLKTTIHQLITNILNDEDLPPKESYLISNGNVDLIPCDIGLTAIEDKLRDEVGSEKALSYIIEQIKADYSYIIVDTAPSLGLLTVNALAASDGIIITVSPQFLSAIGISLLLKTVDKVKKRINPTLKVEGVLMTMCNNRTNLYKDICDAIENSYSSKINIFNTQIPASVKVGEANLNRQSVIEYEPKNKASIAYMNLAKEICENAGNCKL